MRARIVVLRMHRLVRIFTLGVVALCSTACPGPHAGLVDDTYLPIPRTGDGHHVPTDVAVGVVFWNYWAQAHEYVDYHHRPLDRIDVGQRFWLVLDLSDANYLFRRFSAKGSQRFVDDLNAAAASDEQEIVYRLFVAPDREFIGGDPYTAELRIDLAKVRAIVAAQNAGRIPTTINALSQAAAISFGHVPLPLQALQQGRGAVAIGIWDAQWNRPLDEFAVPLRIGSDGLFALPVNSWFSGVDSLRHDDGERRPDAALHIFELGDGQPLQAVLRTKNAAPGELLSWRLDQLSSYDAQGLLALLTHVSTDMANATQDLAVWRLGMDLKDVLFAGVEQSAPFIALTQATSRETLYARVLQNAEQPPIFLPLGILPLGKTPHLDFVGFHDRIETPLDRRWANHPDTCISDWTVLLPPADRNDAPMTDVRSALHLDDGGSSSFVRWSAKAKCVAMSANAECLADMATLKTVVRGERPGSIDGRRMALVLVSHQSNDGLFHGVVDPLTVVRDTDFKVPMGAGSIAFLLGCETAGAAAAKIVRALNAHGVGAVVATQTSVSGTLLGEFLNALSESVGDRQISIGDAFDAAQAKLRKSYGAKALDFVLLGDPSIRVCRPN